MRTTRAAFTLIEMTVILAILLILAAAIVPNLAALKKSRTEKDLMESVARLPLAARNEAVKDQMPVRLRFDGTRIVMEKAPSDGSTPTEVKAVDLGDSMTVESVQLNGQQSDIGTWEWTSYPDGSADRGGIQFSESMRPESLVIEDTGATRWIAGNLPDQSLDQWPAGQLQERS